MTVLDVDSIDAYYGPSHILHDVDLTVEDEVVGLMGRNGVGKTTTLRSIMQLVDVKDGSITLNGEDVVGLSPNQVAERGVGFVPQERRVFGNLSVIENLRMGFGTNPVAEERLTQVFEHFPRLEERTEQKAGTLSGGEQQMLAIARTLVADPEIILMDEPTEGLMPSLVTEVEEIVDRLSAEGYSILLVEQNTSVTRAVADRIYFMDTGEIQREVAADRLADDDELIDRYLGVST